MALGMLIAQTGCGARHEEADRVRTWGDDPAVTADRRWAWSMFFFDRTALVIAGTDIVNVTTTPEGHATFHFDPQRPATISAATPITTDGYLLTAAHVLENSRPPSWVALGSTYAPFRIVQAGAGKEWNDWALIKADVQVTTPFIWSPEPPPTGSTVISGNAQRSAAQGTVIDRWSCPGDPAYELIEQDTPEWYGDSGGPVVDGHGQLVGITIRRRVHWLWGTGVTGAYVIRPSPAFITALIARDRLLNAGTVTVKP